METLGFNSPSHNPENELPQWQQKIANAENIANPYCRGLDRFSARSAIFCRYWTCTFSGRNNQAIGAEVVCHFHRQRKVLRFAQIFEDERGLASGIVMLARIIA